MSFAVDHLGFGFRKAAGERFSIYHNNFAMILASIAPVLMVEDEILFYNRAPAYPDLRDRIAEMQMKTVEKREANTRLLQNPC